MHFTINEATTIRTALREAVRYIERNEVWCPRTCTYVQGEPVGPLNEQLNRARAVLGDSHPIFADQAVRAEASAMDRPIPVAKLPEQAYTRLEPDRFGGEEYPLHQHAPTQHDVPAALEHARECGRADFHNGVHVCPYKEETARARAWQQGYDTALGDSPKGHRPRKIGRRPYQDFKGEPFQLRTEMNVYHVRPLSSDPDVSDSVLLRDIAIAAAGAAKAIDNGMVRPL